MCNFNLHGLHTSFFSSPGEDQKEKGFALRWWCKNFPHSTGNPIPPPPPPPTKLEFCQNLILQIFHLPEPEVLVLQKKSGFYYTEHKNLSKMSPRCFLQPAVASVWGTELNNFLAALAILYYRMILKKWMNSSFSKFQLNQPGVIHPILQFFCAKQLALQGV